MIKLIDLLSERHNSTPNERISKWKEKMQSIKNKIKKAEDKDSDNVKLQKNQIKVVKQTLDNYKLSQSLKKQKK
jgi:hypothetical protein